MDIPKKWTNNKDIDEEEFNSKLLEQRYLFKRLYDLVEEMAASNDKDCLKKSNYEKPAWAERQADAIGYARALSEIKHLLQFTKEE